MQQKFLQDGYRPMTEAGVEEMTDFLKQFQQQMYELLISRTHTITDAGWLEMPNIPPFLAEDAPEISQ